MHAIHTHSDGFFLKWFTADFKERKGTVGQVNVTLVVVRLSIINSSVVAWHSGPCNHYANIHLQHKCDRKNTHYLKRMQWFNGNLI